MAGVAKRECEIKYQIGFDECNSLVLRLKKIGFEFISENIEIDYVPDAAEFKCRQAGLLLRFRGIYGQENDILLTLKIKGSREGLKDDQEIEFLLSKFSEEKFSLINSILKEKIGKNIPLDIVKYNDVFKIKEYLLSLEFSELRAFIEKKRRLYRRGEASVTFDDFPEDMGLYVELETNSPEALDELRMELNLKSRTAILEDYGEIIRNKKAGLPETERRTCVQHYRVPAEERTIFHTGPNICLKVLPLLPPHIAHRDGEFQKLYSNVKSLVTKLATSFSYFYDTILLPTSGTQANEAFFSSFKKSRVILINQGEFGRRLADIISKHHSLDQVSDYYSLERKLQEAKYDLIAIIHHETSTGFCNDLSVVGKIAKKYNCQVFADCISSIGIEKLNMYEQGIHFITGVSSKAISSVPGVSFIVMPKKFLQKRYYHKVNSSLSLYSILPFHLNNMCKHTASPLAFFLLSRSLEYLRFNFYQHNRKREAQMNQIIEVFTKLGITPLAPEENRARANATFKISDSKLRSVIIKTAAKNNFLVCLPSIPEAIQISTFGDINNEEINRFCDLIKQIKYKN